MVSIYIYTIHKDTSQNKNFLTISYRKKVTENFAKNITKIFQDVGVKIDITYKRVKEGKYFSLKDTIKKLYESCVVYK